MSQENVEVVRTLIAAWTRGDYSSAEWATSDVEYIGADGIETKGLDALMRQWRDFLNAWDHLAHVVEKVIDGGEDRVLVISRLEARGRGSGIPITSFSTGTLFTLQEGKVTRVAWFTDPRKALEAAGLSE